MEVPKLPNTAGRADYDRVITQLEDSITTGLADHEAVVGGLRVVKNRIIFAPALSKADKIHLATRLKNLITIILAADPNREKPVSELSPAEIIERAMQANIDLVSNSYGATVDDPKKRELISAAIGAAPDSELLIRDSREYIDLNTKAIAWKLEMYINKKYDDGTGAASMPRYTGEGDSDDIFHHMQRYMIERRDLLLATTYHPDWGTEVQDILLSAIKVAASRPPSNPSIPAHLRPEHEKRYDPDLTYYMLANTSDGRKILKAWIEKNYPHYNEEARKMAYRVFIGVNALDRVLAERDLLGDQTRYHNKTNRAVGGKVDPVLLQNPFALWAYESYRAKNEDNWFGWMSIYYESPPDNGRMGPSGDANPLKHTMQEIIVDMNYQYPTEDFIGKIPHPDFAKPATFDTVDILFLGKEPTGKRDPSGAPILNSEKLYVPGKGLIDADGRIIKRRISNLSEMKIAGFDDFHTAEKGWSVLLELAMQGLPNKITKEQIMEEFDHDTKGALRWKWVRSGAGLAKSFNSEWLRPWITPLLSHYCLRLISRCNITAKEKVILVKEMVEAFRNDCSGNGTLKIFKPEIEEVIKIISNPEIVKPHDIVRHKERKKAVDQFFRKKHLQKTRIAFLGWAPLNFGNEQKKLYAQYIDPLGPQVPPVIRRSGSMIPSSEH